MNNHSFFAAIDLTVLNEAQLKSLYTLLASNVQYTDWKALNRVGYYIQDAYDLTDDELEALKPHFTFGVIDAQGHAHPFTSHREARKFFFSDSANKELYYVDYMAQCHTIRRNRISKTA